MKASLNSTPFALDMEQKSAGLWTRATNAMRRETVWLTVAATVLFTLGIGWMDYITGFEVTWFVFYGIPIFFGGMVGGAQDGAVHCAVVRRGVVAGKHGLEPL